MGSLRILGKTTFHNVWLIDRKNSLILQESAGNDETGLILNLH